MEAAAAASESVAARAACSAPTHNMIGRGQAQRGRRSHLALAGALRLSSLDHTLVCSGDDGEESRGHHDEVDRNVHKVGDDQHGRDHNIRQEKDQLHAAGATLYTTRTRPAGEGHRAARWTVVRCGHCRGR